MFYSIVIGSVGPVAVVAVPPIRKAYGWKPAEKVPTSYPRKSPQDGKRMQTIHADHAFDGVHSACASTSRDQRLRRRVISRIASSAVAIPASVSSLAAVCITPTPHTRPSFQAHTQLIPTFDHTRHE